MGPRNSVDFSKVFEDDKLRILVIGAGGREHALAWKLNQSKLVDQIFVAPGNGGTNLGQKVVSVKIAVDDFEQLVSFATSSRVNLVVPGPEQPLVDGVEAAFRKVGIPVFGPSLKAAAMEGSKTFSKDFMARHNIPTASYRNFRDYEAALSYLKEVTHPVVIKASGLAAGKGVIIPASQEEAIAGLKDIMVSKEFGRAGEEVVIEELLTGQELSILAFADGYTAVALPGAQDHKRIGEGDTGLNTGGMGAYAPAPCASAQVEKEIMDTIVQPTIDGMRRDGFPFVGMLFTGVMLTPDGPKVLEYNVRFGDPETEALLLLLSPTTDLAEIMLACVERRLDSVKLEMKKEFAISVVLASKGYPGSYPKGLEIKIGKLPPGVEVFHAGTAHQDGKVVTAGGRVLVVSASAKTLQEAQELAYQGVDCVHFEGKTFRRDIGWKAYLADPNPTPTRAFTYASAGVSIDAGNELVNRIKPIVKATRRTGCDSDIGGFGGLFDLKAAGFKDPILVSGTDGVGTKLKIAQGYGKHDTIGIDLVAMSVNDLVVQGAEPLFFLDYFACGKLDVATATDVVKGVAAGCIDSGCALVGGETAEMPSLYHGDDYDAAGFAVGAVERDAVLPRPDIKAGDVLLGIASSGVHSNGFSLVRKIIDAHSFTLSAQAPWNPTRTIGDELLEPTTIYVRQLLPAIRKGLIKGLSHITGGGFTENIPRVLPKGTGCYVDAGSFVFPSIFKWLMKMGNVEPIEMARTFNCGIGMVVVVASEQADEAIASLRASGKSEVFKIGQVTNGEGCEMRQLEKWVAAATRS